MANRTNKGQSLITCIDDYVSLDIETTGLDPSFDAIIEIAAVKVVCGQIVDSFTTLIKPPFEIDDFITELTGITNEMLNDAPVLADVLPPFLEFVGESVIVGHNVNFDINFIYDNLEYLTGNSFSNNFIDTMRLSRRLFKDFDNHKLITLVRNFGISTQPTHRALADCKATHACYEYMKQYIATNGIDLEYVSPHRSSSFKASDIVATVSEFDETHPLYGKVCVFTGALSFPRKEAMQLVANVGGINADGINKQTNFLIIGNNDYCPQIKDGKSNKQKKAEAHILSGQDITILSEKTFLDLLSDSQVKKDIPSAENQMPTSHYAYACAISSALASVDVDTEYLRFAVDGDYLDVLCIWRAFRIVIGRKTPYIVGIGSCDDFICKYPQANIKRLTNEYRILLGSPADISCYAEFLADAYIDKLESLKMQNEYHPSAEKKLKQYLNSKNYYKV